VREVLFVAGEPSGDLHGAGVAAELRRRVPDIRMAGIGGAHMQRAGVQLFEHTDRLAVMGFLEVLAHLPMHIRLLREITRRMRTGSVGLVILIDYGGFNMRVAAAARRAGVPVLYYITPQVWASRAGRLAELARTVTRAAVILAFEEKLLNDAGLRATFVGHPLLDRAEALPSRAEARMALGLPAEGKVLAIFPGSRRSEVAHHLEPFVATARLLEARVPGLRVVVSVAPGITLDPAVCPYQQVHASSFTVWRAADAALSKSGTSTLEAAVAGCPLIVAYRTNPVTYLIARRVVTIPDIGLVNVVAGRRVAQEFIQDEVVPEKMADALAPLLDHADPRRAEMLAGLAEVRAKLGTPGAAARTATIALETALP
jgi:lipid-A-disaccharide synthase